MKKGIWRLILGATAILAVGAFVGCQSEETVSGPVTMEDDVDPGVIGYTNYWYPEGDACPNCYLEAWDRSVPGYEMFWYGTSNELGYYEIPYNYFHNRYNHLITIKAWKFDEDLYGDANFVYDNPPEWVDITLYPE